MHKGDPIHQLTDHFADRLCLEASAALGADAQPDRAAVGLAEV